MAKLNRGESLTSEFKRVNKAGQDVWIQASYFSVLDRTGKPIKVVKYATDVTEMVKAREDLKTKVEEILRVVDVAAAGDLTQRLAIQGTIRLDVWLRG